METKICKKCSVEKVLNQFRVQKYNGKERYCSWCKQCEKEYSSLYDKTSEKRKKYKKEYSKKYQIENKEKLKVKKNEYYQKNKERIKEKYKQDNAKEPYWKKEWYKEYRRSPEYREYRKNYIANRVKRDKAFALKLRLRKLICRSFRDNNFNKNKKTLEILGCDFNFFHNYLLQTFKDNYGYEWDEKEIVHIDHKKPLATAKTEEDIIKLCHYTNLQLLKEKDNLSKHDKLNYILENITEGGKQ